MPGLGAIGHLDRLRPRHQVPQQRRRSAPGPRLKPRIAACHLDLHTAERRHGLPQPRYDRFRGVFRQVPDLEQDFREIRHDVQRRTAPHHACMHSCIRRRICLVPRVRRREPRLLAAQFRDHLRRAIQRVAIVRCIRRMPRLAPADGAQAGLALVPRRDLHPGRLADDAGLRYPHRRLQILQHHRYPAAPDLLVPGKCEFQRAPQPLRPLRGVQHAGEKPLHVGRAPAKDPPPLAPQPERIAAPRLPFDRHHVEMPRQHHAPRPLGAETRENPGLRPGLVADPVHPRARRRQHPRDMIGDLAIRLPRQPGKPHQPVEMIQNPAHAPASISVIPGTAPPVR